MTTPSDPVVSVVVPVFNAAATLSAAIASVQRQALPDLEIILVDDASTDASRVVIAALAAADRRIVAEYLEMNAGPAVARNRGLEVARGRWIALLDADDAYLPDRLATLLAAAEVSKAEMVSDNILLVDPVSGGERGLAWPPAALRAAPWIDSARFIAGNFFHRREPGFGFMKAVIDRAFIERHRLRYDPALRLGEDYEFYWACLAHGARWQVVASAHYRYHLTPNSATRCITPEQIAALLASTEAAIAATDDPAILSLLRHRRQQLCGFHQHHAAVRDLKAGRYAAGLGKLMREPAVLPFVADALVTGTAKRLRLRGRHDHGF